MNQNPSEKKYKKKKNKKTTEDEGQESKLGDYNPSCGRNFPVLLVFRHCDFAQRASPAIRVLRKCKIDQ